MNPDDLARWNERYDRADYWFGTAPNAFLAAHRDLFRPGMSVLAVADGEGRNGVFLAGLGAEVLSVDASPVALDKARRLAAERGVALRTELADLERWAWPEARFDAVVAIFIQFAPPELRARLFAGMKRALKPGGLLLLQGYRPEQLAYGTGGPPHAENMYTADLLRRAFGDMEILHLREHDSEIREGIGHDGMSALVDLVARRPMPPA